MTDIEAAGARSRGIVALRGALLVFLLAFAVGASLVPVGAAEAAPKKYPNIVVLGDSYANNYVGLGGCDQQPQNWPAQLGRRTGIPVTRLACTGASLFGDSNVYDQAQRGARSGSFTPKTRAVLIQLGFNDFNGGLSLYSRCVAMACPGNAASFPRFTAARFAQRLKPLVDYVRYYAPNAKIAIVGYPELHAQNARDLCSRIGGLPVTLPNTSAAPAFSKVLQKAQSGAAKRLGIEFVDLAAASAGHNMCSNDPWVRAVLTPLPQDHSQAILIGHPTVRGDAVTAATVARTLGL